MSPPTSPKKTPSPSTISAAPLSNPWMRTKPSAPHPDPAATIPAGAAAARNTRSVTWRRTKAANPSLLRSHPMSRFFPLTLLLYLPLCAADRVVLNNGDTITGTILKKDGPRLVIKSEFLGEVSMPWTAIKSIHADSELFVQIKDKDIIKGQIEADVNQIKVISATGTTSTPV